MATIRIQPFTLRMLHGVPPSSWRLAGVMPVSRPTDPRPGVAVFVFRNGQFLMGQRRGEHGSGSWSVPGGHLEFAETFEQTARREVLEETGLQIANVRFGGVTNDVFPVTMKHYITIWMLSELAGGQPEVREPDKYTNLGWFDFSNLPSPLFAPWQQLLESNFRSVIQSELQNSRPTLNKWIQAFPFRTRIFQGAS